MSRGKLIIISGPSGVGKDTLVRRLLAAADSLRLSVSATTRAPRPGEAEGVDYYFMTPSAFAEMADSDGFLEHAEYVGNRYGTPEAPVNRMLDEGRDVVLVIEVQGALQVLDRRPDAVSVFILPPSIAALEARLRNRGTEDEAAVQRRIDKARAELNMADCYRYRVVNDDLDTAAGEILDIIRAEKARDI